MSSLKSYGFISNLTGRKIHVACTCGGIFILWTQSFVLQHRRLWSAWSSCTLPQAKYTEISPKKWHKGHQNIAISKHSNPKCTVCRMSPLRCILSFSRGSWYDIYKKYTVTVPEQEKWKKKKKKNTHKQKQKQPGLIFLAENWANPWQLYIFMVFLGPPGYTVWMKVFVITT